MIAALALLFAAPQAIGAWGGWGAFREASGARCHARAQPERAGGNARWRPWAAVLTPLGSTRRAALFVRLSARRSLAAPVTLGIDGRRFVLAGNASAAWAPDAATDRAIVAAMRGARAMSVSAVDRAGRPFADAYPLAGAATAIDAAVLACAARR